MSYLISVRKNTLLFLITIGIINTLLAIIVFIYFNNQQKELLYYSKQNIAKTEFKETYKKLQSEINHYKLILKALKENKDLNRFINNEKNIFPYLVEDFIDFTKANENIFQLRFLDKDGNEIIRIDKNNEEINIAKNLQNKSDRYYFIKTKSLKDGEVYISDFDLNVENKRIELPFKPTIRVSTPIYKNDKLEGILIINFLASDLLKMIKDKDIFNVYFMDKYGNFLLHPDENKNWSTQRKTYYKVEDEIKNINTLINKEKSEKGSFDKNLIFYLNKIDLTDNSFYIIYSIKKEIYDTYMKETTEKVAFFFIVLFVLSIPFVLLGAYLQSIRMKILDSLINNIPFPICLKDNKGLFLLVNDSLVKLYGFTSKEQLIGKKSYDFIDKHLPHTSKQRDIDVLKKQKVKFVDTIVLKNNKKLYYDTRIIKLSFLGLFNKTYILSIAIDITAMKTLNQKLEEKVSEELDKRIRTEKLLTEKAKLAEMGNMIDNIIHQWKQPLSIIKVTSQALELNLEMHNLTEEQRKNYILTISENVDFMSETATDFRNFLSPDKIKSEFVIHDCINKILKILFFRFKKNSVELKNNVPKELRVYGYKSELCQVILNILNNALDQFLVNKEISENKEIIIEAILEEKYILLEISDNAGGIEKEDLSKVFDDRFTTKKDKGTGIGLTISKRIIQESFDGDITVKNKDNGASFIIKIAKESTI
ncbi:ATP-binding protein [Halarcobacter bivalviorum]|uniref:histidine kinase n=1 Tax=Halarcobacter bivalviorum TaxID=663364 RepID=A0AAX2A8P4_9BACT|nr:ATP-binding protein [Halarcobacter bivalviorum]AXH12452.1 PAS sensor-containing signal transduction histidine kinase [Halarcobacter bivalviorum]RXK10622.1 hypothetical protein CRV05_04910 [Halarcobacter bivalviorum]